MPHRNLSLFADLTPAQHEQLLGLMSTRSLAAGEVLTHAGSHSSEMYIVAQGTLSVRLTADGEAVEVTTVGPGGWIGEVSALDPGPASATVVALSDCRFHVLDSTLLSGLCTDHPILGSKVYGSLCHTLARRLRATSRAALDEHEAEPDEHPSLGDRLKRLFRLGGR